LQVLSIVKQCHDNQFDSELGKTFGKTFVASLAVGLSGCVILSLLDCNSGWLTDSAVSQHYL
jgi:hypothetical protein